jgi:serine/threonine-protein kinase RsbW
MHQASLQVDTNLETMPQVLAWFEQFHQLTLTPDLWMQAKIALVEGFTNAVRHAHENLPAHTPIDLDVKILPHRVEIAIWDQGPAFDLEALFACVEREHRDPLARDAHWGGVLLKKLRDQHGWYIRYLCPAYALGDRNCLLIQKELD